MLKHFIGVAPGSASGGAVSGAWHLLNHRFSQLYIIINHLSEQLNSVFFHKIVSILSHQCRSSNRHILSKAEKIGPETTRVLDQPGTVTRTERVAFRSIMACLRLLPGMAADGNRTGSSKYISSFGFMLVG